MVLFCTENRVLVFYIFFRFLFLCGIVFMFFFVVFHCMVLLCALALCVYLCVGLLYIDIVYCKTVLHCMWLPVDVINDE